ncbi:MAG TPA: hypothetical protein VLT16_02700 [Candidatus Limnocylindrales bacterium]|nr:hypothetical protein [Candidatus Limnocylindrales bacterium]
MNPSFLLTVLGLVPALVTAVQVRENAPPDLLHVSNSFEFRVHAPQSRVAPLFGAHRERLWAEGWDPQFVFPRPPADRAGAVFSIHHGGHTSTWVTTIFDPGKGHIQHVYFIPDVMTTLIDIQLSQRGTVTRVRVRYERTALSPESNAVVRRQGEQDAKSGPEWQQAIARCLAKT